MTTNQGKLRVSFRISEFDEVSGSSISFDNGSTLLLHGIAPQVVEDIKECFNFTLEMYFSADWLEVWDFVGNNTAELGGVSWTQDSSMTKHGLGTTVMFLHPLEAASSNAYFRQPPIENVRNSILQAFQFNVWISLTCCFIACTTLFFLYHLRSAWNDKNKPYVIKKLEKSKAIGKCPIHLHEYIAACVLLFIYSFFFILFTAKIVSTFATKQNAITTPDDLLKYRYTISTYSVTHIHKLFQVTSKSSRLEKITTANTQNAVNSVKKVVAFKNPDPRYALLSQDDGLFINAKLLSYSQELCLVSSISSTRRAPMAMFIQKDSPHRESFNLKILESNERGISHRYQIKLKKKYVYVCIEKARVLTKLSLSHVSLAFQILVGGACFAIIIECIIYCKNCHIKGKVTEKFRQLRISASSRSNHVFDKSM